MGMKLLSQVIRPAGNSNFPLIEKFILTGEATNPWRCEGCVTQAQRRKINPTVSDLRDVTMPGCCRKCGMDFYR
jgi:hypothetical protein